MPKREDIKKVLVIGSGPIVIRASSRIWLCRNTELFSTKRRRVRSFTCKLKPSNNNDRRKNCR